MAGTVGQLGRPLQTRRQRPQRSGDVEQQPVYPAAGGCILILQHQRKAAGGCRSAAPAQRRREIQPLAGVNHRDRITIAERR